MVATPAADPPRPTRPLDEVGRELLFTDAHTVRNFAPTPVDDDLLREIWELLRWAPTAVNGQPLRIMFVRSPAARRRLIRHLNDGNRRKAMSAPVQAVLSVDLRFHEHIPQVLPFAPEWREVYEADQERRERTARMSAQLQAGYFLLAARAVGLSIGPMGGFDGPALDADFFPDGRWRSMLVVNLGYPGEQPWYERLPRLSIDDAIRWE